MNTPIKPEQGHTRDDPVVLCIAGSDSSAGAGIQADLKTVSALGGYCATVITAITAQNTRGVLHSWVTPASVVHEQLNAVLSDMPVGCVKTGMLGNREIIHTVSRHLKRYQSEHCKRIPVIVDPVLVSSSGTVLLEKNALAALKKMLLPQTTLLTPNLNEAAVLLDTSPAENAQQMIAQAKALQHLGPQAVLLKGGHLPGDQSNDILVTSSAVECFSAPRIHSVNTHGTGCTLASAISAELIKDRLLIDAVKHAKAYLTGALAAGVDLHVGHGHGPLQHFFTHQKTSPKTQHHTQSQQTP